MPTLDELNDFKAALGEALGAPEATANWMANRAETSNWKRNRVPPQYPEDPAIAIQAQADAIAEAVQDYLRALAVKVEDATNVVMKP